MEVINKIIRSKTVFLFVFITTIHIGAFLVIRNYDLFIDEHYHYRQIVRFMGGDRTPDLLLSMIPGYHWTVVGLAKLLHISRFQDIRVISFVLNLLTIPIFYFTAKRIEKDSAFIKTLQFSVFPLLFPYFSLIYTDIFSVLFILLTMWAVYSKHYPLAGIVISLSIFARQNNIFWLIFFILFIYVKEFKAKISGEFIRRFMPKIYTFIPGIFFFAAFLFINKGMTIGDRQLMYLNFMNQSNIFIISVLVMLLFIPLVFSYRYRMIKRIWQYKKYSLLLIPAFILFQMLFSNTHPYNQSLYFLHNALAVFFTQNIVRELFFFAVFILSLVWLSVVGFKEKACYLLYPITFLFLLPVWFMEWRYYMIPCVIFLILREKMGVKTEYALLLYLILISAYFYQGMLREKFFL